MRSWLSMRKKKSVPSLSACYSDAASHSPFQRLNPQGSLFLPTSLDKVIAAAHRCNPTQLPGEDATEDDVRYFLYQVLTHKEHEVIRSSPQWILETCMSWHGGGARLRSLPVEGFQQLCPLDRGHANINWNVRASRFKLQEMPPCGTRDLIAQAVRSVVLTLKAKENGHRGPGWQDSHNMRSSVASQSTDCLAAPRSALPMHPGFTVPSIAAAPAYPDRTQFYGFSNRSMPQFCSTPSLDIYRDSPFMQHGATFAQSDYQSCASEPLQHPLSPDNDTPLSIDDRDYRRMSTPTARFHSPLPSPTLSYAHSDSISSQISDSTRLSHSTQGSVSTARTSPPNSEDDNIYWTSKLDRSCSISRSTTGIQHSLPETYQATSQRTSTGIPNRYRVKSNIRSFDPQLHMAQLRNPSYPTTALSQGSLNSSYGASDRYGYRQDSAMPSEVTQYPLRREASLRPSSRSYSTLSATTRTNLEAPQRGPTPSAATSMARSRTGSVRPSKNYGVDTFGFDTAEQIDYKSRSGPIRSIMVNQAKGLKRGKSDHVLHARARICGNSGLNEESVGPHIRFHDPQTGVPRLTMIETIEQHQQLGKQRLEGQRRVEKQLQNGLKTVYETIEDQEILDGRLQHRVDNVQCGWASYL